MNVRIKKHNRFEVGQIVEVIDSPESCWSHGNYHAKDRWGDAVVVLKEDCEPVEEKVLIMEELFDLYNDLRILNERIKGLKHAPLAELSEKQQHIQELSDRTLDSYSNLKKRLKEE